MKKLLLFLLAFSISYSYATMVIGDTIAYDRCGETAYEYSSETAYGVFPSTLSPTNIPNIYVNRVNSLESKNGICILILQETKKNTVNMKELLSLQWNETKL